jgi:hypothetical protein
MRKLTLLALVGVSLCSVGCEEEEKAVNPSSPCSGLASVKTFTPDPCTGNTEWKIISPANNATIQAGSRVYVEFCWKEGVNGAMLKYLEGRDTDVEINDCGQLNNPQNSYAWDVPAELAGKTIILRLYKYNDEPNKTDITLTVQ